MRTIEELSVERIGDMLHFTFVGEGFLHKMVRILTGTLLEIGAGRMAIEQIDEIFAQKIRASAGETLPAHGLFLDEVYY